MAKHHQVILFDLYKGFRAKYRDVTKPAGYYHFPKNEISDSKYALTFPEWKLIVTTYFKYVLEHLKTGTVFNLPYGLGYWQLVRSKRIRKFVDAEKGRQLLAEGKINKGTFVYNKKMFFNGYYPRLKWYKKDYNGVIFKNMYFVRATLIRPHWEEYWRELKSPDKRHWINNLNEEY